MWRKTLQGSGHRHHVVVVELAGEEVVGFASCGPARRNMLPRRAPYDGEIFTLYVAVDHQGQGHGKRLLDACFGRLREQEKTAAIVWVLAANPARIIDIDTYFISGQRFYSAVMIQNTGANARGWWWYVNATPDFISQRLTDNNARLIDIELPHRHLQSKVDPTPSHLLSFQPFRSFLLFPYPSPRNNIWLKKKNGSKRMCCRL